MALKLREKKKIGLVLSGGGIKAAAFHIGVCLALREKGFRFAGGTKEQVKEQLTKLADHFDVDEIVVSAMAHDRDARKRSFELLSEAFELKQHGVTEKESTLS